MDPATGEVRVVQIFVAVLGASSYTFATARTWQTGSRAIAARSRFLAG